MPDFNLERFGTRRPLLKLPPSGVMYGAGPPVELYVELSKAEAGCYICRRPIPAGTSRVTFTVTTQVVEDVPAPAPVPIATMNSPTVSFVMEDPLPKARRQNYHVHPGCITKPMGSEAIRQGVDCWDCGAIGLDSDNRSTMRKGWVHCFTTHRFAWGVLCPKCQKKPKWRPCGHCEVAYPQHMIHFGQLPEKQRRYGIDEENPGQDSGDWCPSCAERFQVVTIEQLRDAEQEFEETRQRIMKGGLF